MILFILSIPEELRCNNISKSNFGGIRRREKSEAISPNVTYVSESRQDIKDPLDCCNPCRFRNGNGIPLEWTLSLDCLLLVGGNDSIWVIVDRFSKVTHFLPVKTTYQSSKLAELYIARIVSLHGVPKNIVSDRGTQFTSRFWKKVQEGLGTRLDFSTAYHPQTDGQTERVNQTLEDMLRACVLEYGSKWEDCLLFVEFSYNNSYQASLQMAPFEFMYGRKCRTPLNWS